MNRTLHEMMAIASAAAREVMSVYQRPFSVDFKGPNDPVTEADRRANDLICTRLAEAFPGVPVVAEESPEEDWAHFRDHDRVFFVDPVDGTAEFVAKNGQFVVMIGLLEGDVPTHGVVHAPTTGVAWAGSVGDGALRVDAEGRRVELSPLVERSLDQARAMASKSSTSDRTNDAILALGLRELLNVGSAGLKGTAVADGHADIYLAPEFAGSRWDSCAPEAILRALGGVFTDAHGNELNYRAAGLENDDGAVAAAPGLHAQVIARLSDLLR